MRAVVLVASLALAGTAAADDSSTLTRALDALPGVTVTRGETGGSTTTEWRKAGVVYRLEKRKGGDVLLGDDESGAGAVMCTWAIDDGVRRSLADCPSDRFPALRADLDRDVPAIERFIVANSPVPVTVAALHAEAEALHTTAAASEPASALCTAGAAGGFVGALDALGPEGRRAAVDRLLAVPRWPVLNPCL